MQGIFLLLSLHLKKSSKVALREGIKGQLINTNIFRRHQIRFGLKLTLFRLAWANDVTMKFPETKLKAIPMARRDFWP